MGNALAKRRRARSERPAREADSLVGDPPADVQGSNIPHGTEDAALDPLDSWDHCGLVSGDASSVDSVDISVYDYPFENIAFEGGGVKGLAYCGAIQVLEELGIIRNIRRIAGTSAGAITAAFLAVGLTSEEIRALMDEDMNGLLNDHSCGYVSLFPNVIRSFGWNPASHFLEWFGKRMSDIGASPDITFSQVLKTYGKELCIVVTNVNRMTTEYFHPKTTPNVPIRVAVRMSMAIPVFFQAFRRDLHGCGHVDTYVDGGLLCNYPISCFDGWWLSMKPEDSFLQRMNKLEELPLMFEKKTRFGEYNDKTVGFMLYAEKEKDLLRTTLECRRKGTGPATVPNTKLGNKYREKMKTREAEEEQVRGKRHNLEKAIQAFLDALVYHDKDKNSSINMEELRNALEHEGFKEHKAMLFGKKATAENVMKELDADNNGTIEYRDLELYLDHKGFSMTAKFLGYQRRNVTHFFSFLKTLEKTLQHNVQRLVVEEADVERTVGINTCYVGTTDFFLEEADKEYLIQQGRKSTEVFLRAYVRKNNPPLKEAVKSTPSDVPVNVEREDREQDIETDKAITLEVGQDTPADTVTSDPDNENLGQDTPADTVTSDQDNEDLGQDTPADTVTSAPDNEDLGQDTPADTVTRDPDNEDLEQNDISTATATTTISVTKNEDGDKATFVSTLNGSVTPRGTYTQSGGATLIIL